MNGKIILLTGAGFTRNLGGLLGDQIWSLMYSDPKIQGNTYLKDFFLKHRNDGYESIYGKILELKNGYDEEKFIIREIIKSIYDHQEDFIQSQKGNFQHLLHTLGKFIGSHVDAFFTLNQDLFAEKHQMNHLTNLSGNRVDLDWPQVPIKIKDHPGYELTLPKSVSEIKDLRNRGVVKYFKLHGSMNWFDSKIGKNRVIVGGKNKLTQIKNEPLLIEYFRCFEQCLIESEYLLVIGYSFHDDHINEILNRKVIKNGLKMIILDKLIPGGDDLLNKMISVKTASHTIGPTPQEQMRENLASKFNGYYLIESIYDLFNIKTGKASPYFKILLEKMELPLDLLA